MRLVKHFVEAAKNYLENCRRNQSLTQEHSKTIRKEESLITIFRPWQFSSKTDGGLGSFFSI